jgi:hypothetical protein
MVRDDVPAEVGDEDPLVHVGPRHGHLVDRRLLRADERLGALEDRELAIDSHFRTTGR